MIEIDEHYGSTKCDYCSTVITKRSKFSYEKPNTILPSVDICKNCYDKIILK